MEAATSSKTMAIIYHSTLGHISEDLHLYHRAWTFKPDMSDVCNAEGVMVM
jgi:hypothetical protein